MMIADITRRMVEEYGFDLTGAHNGFPSAMAVIFGQPLAGPSETCHEALMI